VLINKFIFFLFH